MNIFRFEPVLPNKISLSKALRSRLKRRVKYWAGPVLLMFALTLAGCGSSSTYAIGDSGPAGGIVFYITEGGKHGLEAAREDQAEATWGCQGTPIAGADGTEVGTGAQNTDDILNGCLETGTAAELAMLYTLNGFDDWFLPSKDELNEMYSKIGQGNTVNGNVGGFADSSYWSSSESQNDQYEAWNQLFVGGGPYQFLSGKSGPNWVRAVRAF